MLSRWSDLWLQQKFILDLYKFFIATSKLWFWGLGCWPHEMMTFHLSTGAWKAYCGKGAVLKSSRGQMQWCWVLYGDPTTIIRMTPERVFDFRLRFWSRTQELLYVQNIHGNPFFVRRFKGLCPDWCWLLHTWPENDVGPMFNIQTTCGSFVLIHKKDHAYCSCWPFGHMSAFKPPRSSK